MKIIFEGTEEQIKNLKHLIDFGSNDLPEDKTNHYQTDNLWSVDDVKNSYNDCSDKKAMEVLDAALINEAAMDQIWFAIHNQAEEMGLERNEEEQY